MTDITHNQRVVEQFTRWAKPFAELPIHAEAGAMAQSLQACALGADATVLDVACGPGILACAIVPHVRHVTGIDITPAMLDQAQARQAALDLANLSWQDGDASALPFGDHTFARVVTRYSFHHMQNPAAVLWEMKRVCRPGGRIVVIDATPTPETRAAYDAMERLRDPSHTNALPLTELRQMGKEAELQEVVIDGYRLEAQLAPLSAPQDMAALTALFEADIETGKDHLGVHAWRAPEGIRFHFPISILAWEVP